MPNCSSDCNRIYGPSVACDICNAIDVATIISNFSVSVLECGVRTFSFLGYSLCLVSYILLCVKFHFVHSNLVKEFIMHSKVERTDIQNSDRGWKIIAQGVQKIVRHLCGCFWRSCSFELSRLFCYYLLSSQTNTFVVLLQCQNKVMFEIMFWRYIQIFSTIVKELTVLLY